MALPESWVESIFARLAVRYGVAFQRQYADMDVGAVKADWSDVLGCFADRPEAIRFALDHLPADKPVTALQFRALGIGAIREERQPALPAPMSVHPPEAVRGKLSAIAPMFASKHPHAWADRLKARQAGGEMLSLAQREALERFDANASFGSEVAA
jgi:hypothetical protein